MNKIRGFITEIQQSDSISIIQVKSNNTNFYSIVLGNDLKLEVGKEVYLLFKETEVSIAKNFSGEISLKNRFLCKVKLLEQGKLLTKVILEWDGIEIVSIITTSSAKRLNLKENDEVVAFVKTNEVSIMEL